MAESLAERNSTTTLTTTLRYRSREVRDIVISSAMDRGVAEGYDRLDELLADMLLSR